jgi:hypothetical protein
MIDDKEYNLYWDYYVNKEKDLSKIHKKNVILKKKIFPIPDYIKSFWPSFFKG